MLEFVAKFLPKRALPQEVHQKRATAGGVVVLSRDEDNAPPMTIPHAAGAAPDHASPSGAAHAAATTPAAAGRGSTQGVVLHNRLTDWIDWARNILYGVVAGFFVADFTGVWKIGRDSALYRGLAHHLATGRGYTFGEFAPATIYPGYPLILAGIEKLFGPGDLASLLAMNLMSLAVLVLTYKLIRLYFDRWIAISVVTLLGLNGWFLALSNDLLGDVPFLLGVMLALYGWECMLNRRGRSMQSRIVAGAVFVMGLALAASVRPTFWIAAAAWGAACAWNILRGRHRKVSAVTLAVLLLLAAVLLRKITGGGYERQAMVSLSHVMSVIGINLSKMLTDDLIGAFFGNKIAPGVNLVCSLLLLIAPVLLIRRGHMLWALLIWGTIAATLLMTTVPRYYVMVLPLMLLGWVLLWSHLARLSGAKWSNHVLLLGLLLVLIPNVARCGREIFNQRWKNPGHRNGWAEEIKMSERIAELVPPDGKVIGPDGASIMSYLSDRYVMMQREVLPVGRKPEPHWPRHVAALGIGYAIFPSTLYTEQERRIGDLMDKGIILPDKILARVNVDQSDPMVLATVTIHVPPPETDWRKLPTTRAASTEVIHQTSGAVRAKRSEIAERHARAAAKLRKLRAERAERHRLAEIKEAKRLRAERLARAERRAAKERKARKAERLRLQQAVTQPATAPAP